MKTTNKNIVYNDSKIQNINPNLCGYYCIYYIKQRNDGQNANKVLFNFYDKPTEFIEMFMKFYISIL